MAYIYDPSQNIKQGFQQAQAGIGDIFTQVIAQQQRDYNLAENTFQNIEALKKNLTIYGQKSITSKANELLAKTGASIQKNGKIDFAELGNMRQQISQIADLKQGYDIAAPALEKTLLLGNANKDNLGSFEKFYKEATELMSNEELISNPQDLQKALANVYSKNLSADKMFLTDFVKQTPLVPIKQDVRNAKGEVYAVATGNLPSDWTSNNGKAEMPAPITVMGPDGKPMVIDYIDQQIQKIQKNNPDKWDLMKSQMGVAGTLMNERAVMEHYLNQVPGLKQGLQINETKSEKQLKLEDLKLGSAEFEAKYQGPDRDLQRRLTLAQIGAINRKNVDYNNPQDLASNGVIRDADGNITVNYGKNVLLNSAQVFNSKTGLLETKPFVVVNRKILANGQQQLIGFVPAAGMNKIEAMQASYAPKDLITTPLTKTNYTNFKSVFVSKPFNKELARRNSIAENLASGNTPAASTPNEEKMTDKEILSYRAENSTVTPADFIKAFKIKNKMQQ